jgi:hypothetical protein
MGWLSWRWGVGGALLAIAMWPFVSGLLRSFVREFGIVAALYAVWNLGGRIRAFGVDQAFERGEQIWEFQQAIHLPSEAWLQELILPYPWIVKSANVYYALAHVAVFGWSLVWMWWRNRDHYASYRTQMALFTGTSLLIQLVAVAPPRFVEVTDMIDTGVFYNQSVYSALGRAQIGQLQAMPSIHVGWALFVGAATYRFATGPWLKWLGVAHAILTMWAVMVTANHYWMDGIVAAGIMIFWYGVLHGGRRLLRSKESTVEESVLQLEPVPAGQGY